jgi:phosphoglycolate phosphatase-like HAD superfamily hydrolase
MHKRRTIFCDIDGTVLEYRKFEDIPSTPAVLVPSVVEYLRSAKAQGDRIIMTTARPESMYLHTYKELKKLDIPFDQVITDLERGPRVLINDMDPKHPDQPRAIAINLERDKGFSDEDLQS